jgi:hypothetical protein
LCPESHKVIGRPPAVVSAAVEANLDQMVRASDNVARLEAARRQIALAFNALDRERDEVRALIARAFHDVDALVVSQRSVIEELRAQNIALERRAA